MKQVEVILWTSDGYDGVSWDWPIEISDKDYKRIIAMAKKYEFNEECDYTFAPYNYEVWEYKAFADSLREKFPDTHQKLKKRTNVLIEESFEANKADSSYMEFDIDAFSYGYYINLEWLLQAINV